MIVPKHYENLNVLHENTMPHRAYYMPASKDMGSLVHDREKSDRMELLNGNWKFQFYKSIYDLQENFTKQVMTLRASTKFQFRESGRTMAMTAISIPMSVTQFRLIRHMYHRRILAERTYTSLNIRKIPKHQKHT